MKKRVIVLLCVLALCLACLPLAMGVEATENIYLVGINDAVMLNLINDTYMPVRRLGVIYAPYTILDNKDLGLSYAVNRTNGTFTVFNREKTLIFYTNGDGCYDKSGNTYSDRVFSRNGNFYLPLRFLATFFDLTYSYYNIPMKEGIIPIVRLCNDRSQLTDGQFGSAVAGLAAQSITQYVAAHTTPSPSTPATVAPTASATPTPTPSKPSVILPTSPTPTPSAPPKAVTFSLAISAEDGAGFSDILKVLEQNHLSALFFFSVDDLVDRDEDVRAAAAKGHQIGLILGETDPNGDFSRGNQLLRHILRSETNLVLLKNTTERDENWCVWQTSVTLRGRTAQAQAKNLLSDLEGRGLSRLTFTDSSAASATLRRFLAELKNRSYTYRIPTETL